MWVTIHANPGLQNQIDCAEALLFGFRKHGIDAEISNTKQPGDGINVVQGPWWIPDRFLGRAGVLWLDRTFYGCASNNVSLGWLNPDGSRDFGDCDKPAKGEPPKLKPMKNNKRCAVVFGDYGRDPKPEYCYARQRFESVWFRPHPQDRNDYAPLPLRGPLETVWQIGDAAIGCSSTVLVDAAINGLHVHSTDPRHVVHGCEDRSNWLRQLSWKQWSLDEIRAGNFWEHLCSSYRPTT